MFIPTEPRTWEEWRSFRGIYPGEVVELRSVAEEVGFLPRGLLVAREVEAAGLVFNVDRLHLLDAASALRLVGSMVVVRWRWDSAAFTAEMVAAIRRGAPPPLVRDRLLIVSCPLDGPWWAADREVTREEWAAALAKPPSDRRLMLPGCFPACSPRS